MKTSTQYKSMIYFAVATFFFYSKDIITCKYTNQRTVTESILSIIKQEPDYAILIQNK